mmetsp:Transcript_68167/g.154268  ORF Transcript_68167/g.154268 Transcript_68167/m.154268 type:complete len:229 (+) Transcript_68167:75-761(+)
MSRREQQGPRGSEEILDGGLPDVWLTAPGRWVELHEGVPQFLVDLHDRGLVATSVAVVWGGENCYYLLIMAPVVPLHDELMRPRDERKAVVLVELLRDVLAKSVSSTPRAHAPAQAVIRVAPQEVTHGPLVRDFLDAIDLPHIVQVLDVGRKAAMLREYSVLHEGRQGKVVEEVREGLPSALAVVLSGTLVVEAVDLRDLPALVVPAKDGDPLGKTHLEAEEQRHTLD